MGPGGDFHRNITNEQERLQQQRQLAGGGGEQLQQQQHPQVPPVVQGGGGDNRPNNVSLQLPAVVARRNQLDHLVSQDSNGPPDQEDNASGSGPENRLDRDPGLVINPIIFCLPIAIKDK